MFRTTMWTTWMLMAPLFAGAPAVALDNGDTEPAILSEIQQRGRLLFQHERALAAATARANASITFRSDERVVAPLTRQTSDTAITVTFVDATPAALYRVVIDLERHRPGPLEVFATPARLDAYERRALAARTLALSEPLDSCGHERHSIVLPDPTRSGVWHVYLMPDAATGDDIPVGGSHRVDTDGSVILNRHTFADTCITLDRSPESIGLMVAAHAGEPAPTEAHVYWNLAAALPMYVGTDTGLWSIYDGDIRPPATLNAVRHVGYHAFTQAETMQRDAPQQVSVQ